MVILKYINVVLSVEHAGGFRACRRFVVDSDIHEPVRVCNTRLLTYHPQIHTSMFTSKRRWKENACFHFELASHSFVVILGFGVAKQWAASVIKFEEVDHDVVSPFCSLGVVQLHVSKKPARLVLKLWCLISLPRLFWMPAIVFVPLNVSTRPRTRRPLLVPTQHVVMASLERDIHYLIRELATHPHIQNRVQVLIRYPAN